MEVKYISKYETGAAVDAALDNGVDSYNEVVAARKGTDNQWYASLTERIAAEVNGIAVPTALADLSDDSTHRVVTDTEKTTWNAMLPNSTKYGATIAMSIDSSTFVVTLTLKDQNGDTLGTAQTIDLPLESVVVGGSYDDNTKKVILTLQSGSTVEFSVADLVAGLQSELSTTNKLNADYVDDTNTTNKFNMQADWSQSSSAAGDFIKNKPTLGTASALDVASSGDASTTEVVKGDDTRVLAVTAQQNATSSGGNGYAIINGINFYVSATAPTGNIPDGSIGVGW